MKYAFFIITAVCSLVSVNAQEELAGKAFYHYIFPSFVEGVVKQKSGELNKALLNYNTLTQEMIFQESGREMALDKIENIDTVYIENRRFIPYGNEFYEVLASTPAALFMQYKTELLPPGANTGFGTSQTSAITNVADLKNSGIAYKLKLPDDYKLISKTVYWLRKNEKDYIIKNARDVQNLFPQKADGIKDFVKANKITFKDRQSVAKLIIFCN